MEKEKVMPLKAAEIVHEENMDADRSVEVSVGQPDVAGRRMVHINVDGVCVIRVRCSKRVIYAFPTEFGDAVL